MSSLCFSCGFQNPPGMRFCGNCGARLAEKAANPPSSTSLPAVSFSPQGLGVMMGADLQERLQRAGVEATGQRRNVTVLFADLTGYTAMAARLDSEDVYDLVQRFIRLLMNDVFKYEGLVDKLTGDGLMALFGAPIAYENNAERAVRAAIDMQADVLGLSRELSRKLGAELSMRVGLHAGSVIVGGVGTDLLMNYTAIGDTVNLAHRIEEAAPPGAIPVSESVYRQTRALFDLQQISVLNPKGIAQPVTAFRVVGAKVHPGRMRGVEGLHAPMIGRDGELDCLKTALQTVVKEGQGQFALVTGEAGMGKTRLTAEFRAGLRQYPVRVVEGASLAYRRSVSYWLIIDLLYNFLGVSANAPQSLVRERLTQASYAALGRHAAGVLVYLEYLLNLPCSDSTATDRLRYLEAGQLRQQVFLAVRDLLSAEARRRPLVLILEDLHWADDASLELLQFLAESLRSAPLFILAISRPLGPDPLEKAVEWAQAHLGRAYHAIHLNSLSHDQSELLLFQLLALPQLPEELRSQILQRAAGVPLYLEEILRMLIDEGVVHREAGRWHVAPGAESINLGVPDTLQGLILARFDRLSPVQRRVLQSAAVVGKDFNLQVLEAVLQPPDPADLHAILDSLVEREFILPQSGDGNIEYTFRHILMSDVIYGTLLRKDRSRLHGQVAEAIETLYADRLDDQIEILANHYKWSPYCDRALYYLVLAGGRAAQRYANTQARLHFEEALTLLSQVRSTAQQVLQVHTGLGDLLVLIGEYAQARTHFEAALESIPTQDTRLFAKERSALQRRLGTVAERSGDYDSALQHLAEAQISLKNAGLALPVETAKILNDTGWIHSRRGDLAEAEKSLAEASALLENSTQYDVIASIYNRLGGVCYQKEQLDLASHYVRKSLVLRQEIGDTIAVARSYNNLGLLGWKRGDWEGALANFRRSEELHADLGDVEGSIQLHSNLGLLLTDLGDLEEARKHLEESLNGALQIGHSFLTGLAYHHLTRFWLAAMDWQKSLEYCERALATFTEIKAEENLIDLYASAGEAHLGLGNLAASLEAGQTALRLVEAVSGPADGNGAQSPLPERGRILRLLGNLARVDGDWPAAERLLGESAAHFTSLGVPLELGRTLAARAALARARGDATAARLFLNEARLIFRQLGAKLDLRAVEKGEG